MHISIIVISNIVEFRLMSTEKEKKQRYYWQKYYRIFS
jgi:hypothetical protein